MQQLLFLIKSVPDVIWAGLLALFLTLGGVLLSNRGYKQRLRMQPDHDAAEKAKERTAILRRKTYLRAA